MPDRERFRENRFKDEVKVVVAIGTATSERPYLSKSWRRVLGAIGFVPAILLASTPSLAQILPDTTLPANSIVTPDGNTFLIDGGTAAGSHLFHSFDRFDLPTGFEVLFDNPAIVENIFSRVTGGSISNIDGLIRANGTANLFLLNPNGILFGPNAQLDIGGSFFATSAESLLFENGIEFSATDPNGAGTGAPPLLSVNVPIGLQFGAAPGAIVNRSIAPSSISHPQNSPVPLPGAMGLEVRVGESITLLGGDLRLEGGNLTTLFHTTQSDIRQAGTLELGSIAGPDRVNLTPTPTGFALGYEEVGDFGNIELSGGAIVNADGLGGGAIRVRGDRISLNDGSSLQADTWGDLDGRGIDLQGNNFSLREGSFVSASTFDRGGGGGIRLYASESVDLTGTGFQNFQDIFVIGAFLGTLTPFDRTSGLFSLTGGEGNAGNLTIETGQLTMTNGALAVSPTFARGAGGDLSVTAVGIEIAGSSLSTGTYLGSTGIAGNIEIATQNAIVRDGGSIQAFTLGAGSGGNIFLSASDSVEILRDPIENETITGIATTTLRTGAAGNITVETGRLILRDGGEILTTSGLASPGLGITDPRGERGGTLIVRASESIELSGISEDGVLPSGLLSSSFSNAPAGNLSLETGRLTIRDGAVVSASTVGAGQGGNVVVRATESVEVAGRSASGQNASSLLTSSGSEVFATVASPGSAGDLRIITDTLIVRDGGEVSVSSLDTGNSGTLEIDADSIRLDNNGIITAATNSGTGGNITLRSSDLQLRRGSRITTNAGNTDGGNITLDIDAIAALENSDITANAALGRGGRVEIAAQGIFGTEFRSGQTPQSDITATSDLGAQFDGSVTVRTPDIDPSTGLVQLPSNPTDPQDRVVSRCEASEGSTFAIVGEGGLPEDPTLAVRETPSWSDTRNWRELGSGSISAIRPRPDRMSAFVEATGWIRQADGTIVLVSAIPEPTSFPPLKCQASFLDGDG